MNVDFSLILKDLNEFSEMLNTADIHKKHGFTEQQVKYINWMTVEAVKRYHDALVSQLEFE